MLLGEEVAMLDTCCAHHTFYLHSSSTFNILKVEPLHSVEIAKMYSHDFSRKNYVKATNFSLKLLYELFPRNIVQVWVNFSFLHIVTARMS